MTAIPDGGFRPDALDLALLTALREHPRVGDLELSRVTKVARATVQSRLRRLQDVGVIAGWGPDIDTTAAGFPVQAFVTLEIAQGALEGVREELSALPHVLEAYVTTGASDVLCKVGASSHADLQQVLVALNRSSMVVRSTSVVVLSRLISPRSMPLLASAEPGHSGRAPAYRKP
jgi:DNA-binding Lrp family transcriptional regulator